MRETSSLGSPSKSRKGGERTGGGNPPLAPVALPRAAAAFLFLCESGSATTAVR
jgi:hypothetical protein